MKYSFNDKEYDIVISYKNIKNMYMRIKNDLCIYISAPVAISNRKIIEFVNNNSRFIEKNLLNPFVFDVENCPDCAPSLAVLAAFCDGKSVLLGTGRLKLKESDRSKEIVKLLSSFGIEADDKGDRIEIYGTGTLRGAQLALPDDHRIVMAAAIAASGSVCPSVLSGEQAVSKSYPSFFDDFILLGGKADVLTV